LKHLFVKSELGKGMDYCLGCGYSQTYARTTCDGRLYPLALAQIDVQTTELEARRQAIHEAQRSGAGPAQGFKTREGDSG
jgi:hypothetical protein